MFRKSSLRGKAVRLLATGALALPLLLGAGCGVFNSTQSAEESVSTDFGSGVAGVAPDVAESYDYSSTDESALKAAEAERSAVPASGEDASTVPADQRMIVRTVDMRVKVDDVEKSIVAVRKAVDSRKGIVTDMQISTDEDVPIYRPYVEGSSTYDGTALSGYVTVRVPAESLESFITEVGDLGEVVRQAENESDVTQQHLDLSARLKNLQATETRLREFFDKAKNVTEMLAIEQELTRVRGDIEAMQAEIAYLERQAALSTVTIELVGPTPVVRPTGEDWGFVDALTQAVRGFVNTINVLIVLTGALAPVILLALVAFFIIRALVRRRRAAASEPTETDHDGTEQ